MFKDTKANKIFMISVLAILFVAIVANKSAKTQKTTFDSLQISQEISIDATSNINIWVDDSLSSAKIIYSTKGNGQLDVKSNDGVTTAKESLRKVFFLSFDFEDDSSSINLYLPSEDLNNIKLKTTSGDINSYSELNAKQFVTESVNGDVNFLDINADSVKIETITGDIMNTDIFSRSDVELNSTSGDISVNKIDSASCKINSVSGDVVVIESNVSGNYEINTTSGDISVELAEDSGLKINTVSGDIEIDGKEFGSPYSSGDERYKFQSISGDIEIDH